MCVRQHTDQCCGRLSICYFRCDDIITFVCYFYFFLFFVCRSCCDPVARMRRVQVHTSNIYYMYTMISIVCSFAHLYHSEAHTLRRNHQQNINKAKSCFFCVLLTASVTMRSCLRLYWYLGLYVMVGR